MPTLRLFANLRESAGVSSADIAGSTVGEVLGAATEAYGPTFAAGLETARIWVNGEPTTLDSLVASGDEIALIPPVSGGTTATGLSEQATESVLALAVAAALLLAAWVPVEWFALIAAGACLAWVWDLSDATTRSGIAFNPYPALIAPVVTVTGAFAWGIEGFAGAVALTIVISLSWPVFDRTVRDVGTTVITTTIVLAAGLAAGGMMLLRLQSTAAIASFVAIATTGIFASWLASVYGAQIQSLDPNVGALLGALLAGVVAGLAIEELDTAAALLGAVGVAAGLIAGRTLGSMIRTGAILHTARSPGTLSLLDGVFVAAPIYWLALWIFG